VFKVLAVSGQTGEGEVVRHNGQTVQCVALREIVPTVQCEVLTGNGQNANFGVLTESVHFVQ
jgi:hypothetical protein